MTWFIVISLILFVTTMAVAFTRIARAIRQDFRRRFRAIEAQLERDATSLLDPLLSGAEEDEGRRSS